MSFDNPLVLGFLSLFVIFIPIVIVRYRKNRKAAALFAAAAPSDEREALFRELRLRMILADVFFLFFTGFLIIALAGPRWGLRIVSDYRRGVDVILAFDISRSMNVRDCLPLAPHGGGSGDSGRSASQSGISRLDRGIGIAQDLAATLGDIRLGAVIGKGRGVLAVPLTYDSETILNFLYGLDSMAVTGAGTNLESLIDAASASFQDSVPSRRGIILFSDGEALTGSLQTAMEKARKAGIALSVVGLGSDEGGPVPIEAGPETPAGVLLAADGSPVISARQAESLRNGAEKSGGVYVDGGRNDAATVLAEYVNSLSAESRLTGHRREANPRWRIFVLAAMACLAGARILGFSRRGQRQDRLAFRENIPSDGGRLKKLRGGKKNGAVLLCLFCLFLASSCGRAQGKLLIMEGNFFNTRGFYTDAISSYLKALNDTEAAPYAEYGLASAYFSLEEGEAALERYKAAEMDLLELKGDDHPELRYRIYYNMGIIYFEKGEYAEAAKAFRDALKVDGSRIEAKRNLELSLLTINRTSSPQAISPQGKTEDGRQGSGGASSTLFEYLRQKEQEQWKSKEWTEENDTSGLDY